MQEIYDIWFSRINLGNKIKLKILEDYKNTEEIWNKVQLNNLSEFENKIAQELGKKEYEKNLEKILEYMNKNKISIVNCKDKDYPKRLQTISDRPALLYAKGNKLVLNEETIAIVGARDATEYGKKVAKKFGAEFSNKGITIVSGLAVGIDKYAHLGALEGMNKKTIAVLGNGLALEDFYPKENMRLYERILENEGCIVSEYPLGTKPQKYYFPARNRIISGLSEKVVIVEASKKSGSLITADFALEQGRDVYAVPGTIFSNQSEGTNSLLKDGAYPLLNVDDIL